MFWPGVLAGCLPLAPGNGGLEHAARYGIADAALVGRIGFTCEDVERRLSEAVLADRMDLVERWYGGCRFGREEPIVCPRDILPYVRAQAAEPGAGPGLYSVQTSGNSLVWSISARTQEHARLEEGPPEGVSAVPSSPSPVFQDMVSEFDDLI